jgi:hypothetical protein
MNDVVEDVKVESSTTEVVEAPIAEPVKEDVKIPTESAPKSEEKVVPYDRFKKVNDELAALKKQPVKLVNKSLDVEDYIDISASLEGLDQREKEKLAKEHKLTGRPLTDIRKDEDFLLWQSAYKQKLEKENALKPSSTQSDSDRPISLVDRLQNASLADKEKILTEAGLYKAPKSKTGRVTIGG